MCMLICSPDLYINLVDYNSGSQTISYLCNPLLFFLIEFSVHKNKCGGTLISHKFVLTSAHCISNAPDYVRFGEYNTETNPDCVDEICTKYQDYKIKYTFAHPNYTIETKQNDIGLIFLEEKVKFTDHIRPVCAKPFYRNVNNVRIAGWSTNKDDENGKKKKKE